MEQLELIRRQIKTLYETNPQVHMNVSIKKPRICLENAQVKITGVYRNIFQVEECSGEKRNQYTLQYTDVFIRNIVILELEQNNTTQ